MTGTKPIKLIFGICRLTCYVSQRNIFFRKYNMCLFEIRGMFFEKERKFFETRLYAAFVSLS
jgi:hypothetical protein